MGAVAARRTVSHREDNTSSAREMGPVLIYCVRQNLSTLGQLQCGDPIHTHTFVYVYRTEITAQRGDVFAFLFAIVFSWRYFQPNLNQIYVAADTSRQSMGLLVILSPSPF